MVKKKQEVYDINTGKHYSDMEYIRLHPSFYLGVEVYNTAAREVTDNAFDEITKGYASTVHVTFHSDNSITVIDDGRGIPAEGEREGMNGIMFYVGQPRSGSNFDNVNDASAGTHGIGVSATNAVSKRMDVTVWRDGKEYFQSFKEGEPGKFVGGQQWNPDATFTKTKGSRLTGKKTRHKNGTRIRFLLDDTVSPDDTLNIQDFIFRLNVMARLVPNSTLIVEKEDGDATKDIEPFTYKGPWGMEHVYSFLFDDKKKKSLKPALVSGKCEYTASGRTLPIEYEVAFLPYTDEDTYSFVNGVYSPNGGSHHTSVLKAIGDALADKGGRIRGLDLKKGENAPGPDDYMACISAAISVKTPNAPYTSQDKLLTKSVPLANALRGSMSKAMTVWCGQQANADTVKSWAQLALKHAREVESIKIARSRARKQTKNMRLGENLRMPLKLLPSRKTGRNSGAELFICEGDSAASALKAARNAELQAVFPIRGKIPNAYDMTVKKALANKEIADITTIMGASIGKDCNPEKSRYERIIIATDSDPDGIGHIASLCILLFYEMFPGFIDAGMLYIALPPLFIVSKGKEKIYCLNAKERDRALKKLGRGAQVTREKGLGETDASSLHDTVMNPATRALIQINNDVRKSRGYTIDTFFGKDTAERKDWIGSLHGLEMGD